MKSIWAAIALAGTILFGLSSSIAQDYPNRALRIIVPLTPGSGADIVGRLLAKKMSESWSQPILVENRAGAGTQIGTQAVARATPDGYTLLVQSASHAVNPALYKSLPYDSLKDFVDVAMLASTPYVMVAGGTGPYRTLQALIDAARAKPGDVAFASAGVGTSTHLVAEYFALLAKVKLLHIPYKGSAEAIQDTLAGRTAFYMAPVNAAIGHLKDGRLIALGVGTERRTTILPDVPTIAEQGVTGYAVNLWFGMWAPAGTPANIVNRLNAEVARSVAAADVREQFSKLGMEPAPMSPEAFAKYVRAEIAINQRIVADGGIERQ
ncbi:MAG: tripartite tricarboxylate transporter substrate binding protein [Burkholderiales bacterium]